MAAELRLAVAYELLPENAPRFADDILEPAAGQGIALDRSRATLDYLDSVLASLRAGGVTVEQVPEVLLGFGCVLGEVVAASTGGSWVRAGFAVPFGIRLQDGTLLDPVGHAFTALASGATFKDFPTV